MPLKKVLILGGGIAGVASAIAFRKKGFSVELVSDRDYLFIYPISIWIPFGKTSFSDVSLSLEALSRRHGFTVFIDRVLAIDAASRTVTYEKRGVTVTPEIVVIALGASKKQHKGIEHTVSICGKPEESLVIKERIEVLVARGKGRIAFGFGGNPEDPSSVRGGPAFELLFNLHHYLKHHGKRKDYEITFFAPMKEPGARMGKKALSDLAALLEQSGIETRFGKKITRFESDGVVFEDESRLPSDFMMFIPAGSGNEAVVSSDLQVNSAGFIVIDNYCRIEGVPGWYAVGDAAALEGPSWKAKQGHIAELMADNAAFNASLEHLDRRGEMKGYREHLHILCVMDMGNGAGFVYTDGEREHYLSLPLVGHWLKKGWGSYYKLSKMGKIPRFPGL